MPRAVVELSGDDLAASRLFGVFAGGDELRAAAAAEAEEEATAARAIEEERLRQAEEQEAAREAVARAERERVAAEQAAQRAADAAAAQAAAAAAAPAADASGPTAAQWLALRQCESHNNYGAVSSNGLYRGAYQFYQGTWDNTARSAGRTDLVGVRPNEASPADQDALARALYDSRGSRPWPHCGVHLR